MPRKSNQGLEFKKLIEEYSNEKLLSFEDTQKLLEGAYARAYSRYLSLGEKKIKNSKLPDPITRCSINLDNNVVSLFQVKKIVATEDDIVDDMLETDLETAIQISGNKDLKAGDEVSIYEEDTNHILSEISFKNLFRTAVNFEARNYQNKYLYNAYKSKIGDLVSGTVLSVTERSIEVKLSNYSATLRKNNMIGKETYNLDDPILVYLDEETINGEKNVVLTRSSACFLRKLFEREVSEVADETVSIKAVYRIPGKVSKVVVKSNDLNVDPVSACVGKEHQRIDNIKKELGHGLDFNHKERVFVIPYSEIKELFICDSLKPIKVIGIKLETVNNMEKACCILDDADVEKCLRGENLPLAEEITKTKINIKKKSEADEEGLSYELYDELRLKENDILKVKQQERFAEISRQLKNDELVKAQEKEKLQELLKQQAEAKELAKKQPKPAKQVKSSETNATPAPTFSSVEEEMAKYKKLQEAATTKEEEHVEVNKTIQMDELMKSLTSDDSKKQAAAKKKVNKPKKETKEEVKEEKPVEKKEEIQQARDIYTEEELQEIEEQNQEDDSNLADDINLDEDEDYDDYYDEDER